MKLVCSVRTQAFCLCVSVFLFIFLGRRDGESRGHGMDRSRPRLGLAALGVETANPARPVTASPDLASLPYYVLWMNQYLRRERLFPRLLFSTHAFPRAYFHGRFLRAYFHAPFSSVFTLIAYFCLWVLVFFLSCLEVIFFVFVLEVGLFLVFSLCVFPLACIFPLVPFGVFPFLIFTLHQSKSNLLHPLLLTSWPAAWGRELEWGVYVQLR